MKTRDVKKNKLKDLTLTVNDTPIDLPMRIDPTSGRVQFQKVLLFSSRNISAEQETCQTLLIFLTMKGFQTDRVRRKGEYLVRKRRRKLLMI